MEGNIEPYTRWPEMEQMPVDEFFGLSRASYVVIPRLAIQEMSLGWQEAVFDRIEEMVEQLGPNVIGHTYAIERLDDEGRPMKDPLADYRHGRIFADPPARQPAPQEREEHDG